MMEDTSSISRSISSSSIIVLSMSAFTRQCMAAHIVTFTLQSHEHPRAEEAVNWNQTSLPPSQAGQDSVFAFLSFFDTLLLKLSLSRASRHLTERKCGHPTISGQVNPFQQDSDMTRGDLFNTHLAIVIPANANQDHRSKLAAHDSSLSSFRQV